MKKLLYVFAIGGFFAFASCDSPAEDRADQVEENAEDRADQVEEAGEEQADRIEDGADTTAVIE